MLKILFKRFAKTEDGGTTIEACLWIPIYLLFMMLVFDASMMFAAHSNIQRITQDGARQFVAGGFDRSEATLETWLERNLARFDPDVSASAVVDGGDVLTVRVQYGADETSLTGAGSMFSALTMRVSASSQMEG